MKTIAPRSLLILVFLVLAVPMARVSIAQNQIAKYEGPTVLLQQLDEEECSAASERQLDVPLHGNFEYCLMIFDDTNGNEYGSSAKVRINSEIVSLKRTSVETSRNRGLHGGPRTVSRYRSADKSILVVLDIETVDDNCDSSEGKCCGAYYEGSLTVNLKRQKTSFPVYFYRGG